jgi:hypothetical protein
MLGVLAMGSPKHPSFGLKSSTAMNSTLWRAGASNAAAPHNNERREGRGAPKEPVMA